MVAIAHVDPIDGPELRVVPPLEVEHRAPRVPAVVDALLRDERAIIALADVLAVAAVWLTAGHRVGPVGMAVLALGVAVGRRRSVGIRAAVLPGLPKLWGGVAVATLVAAHVADGVVDAVSTAVSLALVASVGRGVAGGVLADLHRRGIGVRPMLVVGSGKLADTLAWKATRHRELGLRVVGTLAPCGQRGLGWGLGVGALAADLPGLVRRAGVLELLVITEDEDAEAVSACLEASDGTGARVSIVPPVRHFLMDPRRVEHLAGIPVIGLGRLSRSGRTAWSKRVFDVAVAGGALLLLAPVLAAVALAVRLDSPGPILFRQPRVGHRGRVFPMLKFRSMVVGADSMVGALSDRNETDGLLFKLRDDPRVTRVGRFIRKVSLDELPQLLNVLKGDMSIVGPRPLPVADAGVFGAIDGKRLNVRPGITGLWQTLGRSDIGYDEMVKLDLAYIQSWSFWTDAQILLRTVPVVLRGEGAY